MISGLHHILLEWIKQSGMDGAYKTLVGTPEGRLSLGTSGHAFIEIDHKGIGFDDVNRIQVAYYSAQQQAVVNAVIKILVPSKGGEFRGSFSINFLLHKVETYEGRKRYIPLNRLWEYLSCLCPDCVVVKWLCSS